MCGIFAYLAAATPHSRSAEPGRVRRAADACRARGPDGTRHLDRGAVHLAFHRLAIIDRRECGMQPFERDGFAWVCNGEIYNHRELRAALGGLPGARSDSDCEVPGPLLAARGPAAACRAMDGVFALIAVDRGDRRVTVARDTFGVRSLYWARDEDGNIGVASELKSLAPLFGPGEIEPFPPGCWAEAELAGGRWTVAATRPYRGGSFHHAALPPIEAIFPRAEHAEKLRRLLERAVEKRLVADRPVGCLLSGGLDSSGVAALASGLLRRRGAPPLRTFAVGLRGSPDLEHARAVARHLGTEHHECLLEPGELFGTIPDCVRQIESYDITTVRASTPMYALCRYIRRETDVAVILSGEGSDELSGSYRYFHHAPDDDSFQRECERLVAELHRFDNLRCDKCAAGAGLEARVPFLDLDFAQYYLALPPALRRPAPPPGGGGPPIEKPLLREALAPLLPPAVVWRIKDGMSDGISAAESPWYSLIQARVPPAPGGGAAAPLAHHLPPPTPEAAHYRRLFDNAYPGCAAVLPHYWMPRWCAAAAGAGEPSGRVVPPPPPRVPG